MTHHGQPGGHAPQNPQDGHAGQQQSGERAGQFGETGQSGQGTDLTRQMESTGPSPKNTPGAPDLIPWDPTGKLDDLVERRQRPPAGSSGDAGGLGSPKGGGDSARQEDAGPGRYGGSPGAPETLSANRYAGASDAAPTDETAGATTTLAAIAAAGSDHTQRQATELDRTAPGETWQGGAASQQAMQGSPEFGPGHTHEHHHHSGGGSGEVH